VVKNYCNTAEAKQKEIIIKNKEADKFNVGEEVLVEIDEQQAVKSIILAYVIPLILMISTIIVAVSYQQDEIIGGICGIIVLIPYYFGLFLLRNKFRADFKFIVSAPRTTQGRN
jgi:sigma-E factor negative regulatory protein RseC